MNIPGDLTSSNQPLHLEVDTSSNSHTFESHQFQRELCLPRVDVNKFDGSNPTRCFTQMEHYLYFHGITNELDQLCYSVLHLDPEQWKWWQWHKKERQGYVAWTYFVTEIYDCFDTDTHHLSCLTKLKQTGPMENCIVSFEQLDFRTEGMTDVFFQGILYQWPQG
jgi:hypothetical protein